ncbi:PRTRC system ThiF family protein [Massilia sp. LC238]|uniref:PRTRC system ThiF family protein n=1 Tax=Massilia sp. LC238 TaxID=1502852 RepID=UPI0004E31EDA|nr:PRTRC system ThiF family protein [Massilia sp. LC238]KFC61926.1 thiamine biosynthesis protein ThiF [Massilia sp. LC238]
MPHITPPTMLSHKVRIALIGCGGNGSQMLTGLARLNHAITALGHPGLHVKVFDPDTVSEANMGRQLFGAFDVGASKAHVLVNRINAFFGLDWEAVHGRYDDSSMQFGMAIACVDSARARHEIHAKLQRYGVHYLMDLGNRAADGQVLFGELFTGRAGLGAPANSAPLPSPYQVLPELVDLQAVEDDTPSCGLAEALERQELFVNQSIVTPALSILWEFFRKGQLTWHGAFVNLRTGSMRPLNVREPAAAPAADLPAAV